jgi:hypothetical protein|tara:strand:- start:3864 stop:4091 length:228 start_codon:yes stop_codon:yes gene_type:complete
MGRYYEGNAFDVSDWNLAGNCLSNNIYAGILVFLNTIADIRTYPTPHPLYKLTPLAHKLGYTMILKLYSGFSKLK